MENPGNFFLSHLPINFFIGPYLERRMERHRPLVEFLADKTNATFSSGVSRIGDPKLLAREKEADFCYGLVRVRENVELIAFYGGENNEMQLLLQRFKSAFENLTV